MLHTQLLIVGQGIAGTLLSVACAQRGMPHQVIDLPRPSASRVASAIINPLVGKRWTVAAEVQTRLPAAIKAYRQIEEYLGVSLLRRYPMLVFHDNALAAQLFAQQIQASNPYVSSWQPDESGCWQYAHGVGCVQPVFAVDALCLLQTWRSRLQAQQQLLEEHFDFESLQLTPDAVQYKGIAARQIVFCEGAAGSAHPLFRDLPFTRNRGDVLLLHIPELSRQYIYHQKLRLLPYAEDLFWYGSNYTWQYDTLLPDEGWRNRSIQALQQWLKLPFSVVEHQVAERPTTAGQRPLLLQNSQFPQVYFFNGLGTRGFSVGPIWAQEMMALLAGTAV